MSAERFAALAVKSRSPASRLESCDASRSYSSVFEFSIASDCHTKDSAYEPSKMVAEGSQGQARSAPPLDENDDRKRPEGAQRYSPHLENQLKRILCRPLRA